MTEFVIEARGEATEYYSVEAETEEEAREIFWRGDAGRAFYTEVTGSEIHSIKEEG